MRATTEKNAVHCKPALTGHGVRGGDKMTLSSDAVPTAPVPPTPGLFQRFPPALPAVVFLAAGGMALLAYLALPWATQTCYAFEVQNDPTCPAWAAAHPIYPADSYGLFGSSVVGQPYAN